MLAVLLICPIHSGLCVLNERASFIQQRQVDWDIGTDIFLIIMILEFTKIVKLEMKKKKGNETPQRGESWCFLDVFMMKFKM